MTNSRFSSWAKPAISVAGAGLGAALAGPLGGALGGWLGEALGPSTSKLLKASADKFGEKVVEKIADLSADSLGDKLKATSIQLEGVYREALRQSLRQIQSDPELEAFGDWFTHWDRCLADPQPLNLASINAGQLTPDKLDGLFRDTMTSLDAQGRALSQNQLSLRQSLRVMPGALESALSARLPTALRQSFHTLIAKPEYEAAWKEATQFFQDAAQEALESIDRTTQRIDLKTQEIGKDAKAIREILAVRDSGTHEPDAPLLGFSLVEPATIPRVIAPARDRAKDVREGLITEARRLGAPDPLWLSKALAGRNERLKEARRILESELEPARWDVEWWIRSRDAGTPIDNGEEYAIKLEEWYRLAAYQLMGEHDAQTSAARSVLLVFRISNAGRIPAEKATVNLSFPREISVGEYVGEPQRLHSPPEIPPSLKDETKAFAPTIALEPIAWYPGWETSKPSWRGLASRPEFFRQEPEHSETQVFRAWIPRLEHGGSQLTRSLRVNFKAEPARCLNINYTLHATNQPSDSGGEISIEVIEAATPPKV